MNREDTVALVERIWATWGVDLPQAIRKQTYDAWHRVIHDLDSSDCARALDDIVIEDRPWPPRPGTLRRHVIDANDPDRPPTAAEAWAQLMNRADAINHGTDVEPLHSLVAMVAAKLGVSQQHLLHTNGDRELFMRKYEETLVARNASRYGIAR
jgi:hypothetical protein